MSDLAKWGRSAWLLAGVLLCGYAVLGNGSKVSAAGEYRVLAPIESGNLLLFPVVRAESKSPAGAPFLTLDEGLKQGSVEVTEASKVRGLVRRRDDAPGFWAERPGDQVDTLVLVNNSSQPLLLLAGEIVTGGKQDRVIAKDRIVPPGSDPIDLSVFCIEPGRWTESSSLFGASAKGAAGGFMVQPAVREQAMAARDQQRVWDSVHGSIAAMAASGGGAMPALPGPSTTSYAKAMLSDSIKEKVDDAAGPLMKSREQIMNELRRQGAIGVVAAVRGEIVWTDLFSSTNLLARYWTKLVRSYAAESLAPGESRPAPSVADAQRFLEMPAGGRETSEGSVGVYRYSELRSGGTETFVLESLLPNARYEVHISKMKLRHEGRLRPLVLHPVPRPPAIQPVPAEPRFMPQ